MLKKREAKIIKSRSVSSEKPLDQEPEIESEEQTPLLKKPLYRWQTVSFAQAPLWTRDNPFIHTGYRQAQFSCKGCLESLFYLHNEWGNVYSHLIGVLLFFGLWIVNYYHHLSMFEDKISMMDQVIMSAFFSGTITCLTLSSLFHLFSCHSEQLALHLNKLDYLGIAITIVCQFMPTLYYGFYCDYFYRTLYVVSCIVLGTFTAVLTILPQFMGPRFRVYRTALFMALGGSGLCPMMHLIIKHGIMYARYAASFDHVIFMGLMYVLGGCLYASRIPERWYPGKFDLWLHSHQIFHLLVVGAAFVHYQGTMAAFKFRHTHLSTCEIEKTWLQSVY